ncbi:hypothetical protein Tco_1313973 [Tanacetum coccineum]
MRNKIFMHTVRDDSILGSLKFVSKSDEYQVYGALLPEGMTNLQMRDSPAYKTYLAFAIGAATPKKARKFKKPASPSKKKALVAVEEPAEKPVKKLAARRYKRETNIHQAGDSSKGVDLESEVLDEPKGKTIDTSEGTGLKPGVPDVSKADTSEKEDEFVHTLDDYVPTDDENVDDENVDDEEYEHINKEMYNDVNVELKDTESPNEEKGNEEITHAENVNAEHKEVSQEVAGDQVKDDAKAIVIAAPATQKTEVTLQTTTSTTAVPDSETLSAIHLRVSDLEKEVKELKNVDHSLALRAIKSEVPSAIKEYLGISLDDALYKAKSNGTSKGTTKSQSKSTGKSAQAEETVFVAEDTQVPQDLGEDMGNTNEPPVVESDQQLYKFMEGDFPRLHLNDIEDMLLLVVQNRLFNLKGEDIVHLAVALRMCTRRIAIQKRVEYLQLGVESY